LVCKLIHKKSARTRAAAVKIMLPKPDTGGNASIPYQKKDNSGTANYAEQRPVSFRALTAKES
jgi:hypothetical protein